MDALASRYRPQVFREVFAQDYPVRVLSQLIKKGQRCRNILLYGSVGSETTGVVLIQMWARRHGGFRNRPLAEGRTVRALLRRGAHGLCVMCAFVTNPNLPPTNNDAETALRHAVIANPSYSPNRHTLLILFAT